MHKNTMFSKIRYRAFQQLKAAHFQEYFEIFNNLKKVKTGTPKQIANKAQNKAVTTLVNKYPDEFAKYYIEIDTERRRSK